MPKKVDLIGKRFGRLTVVEKIKWKSETGSYSTKWRCICDCGNEVLVYHGNLKRGTSNSCGCLQRELIGNRTRTHGGTHDKLYNNVYNKMKSRCYRHYSDNDYRNYNERGIKICDEWLGTAVIVKV